MLIFKVLIRVPFLISTNILIFSITKNFYYSGGADAIGQH